MSVWNFVLRSILAIGYLALFGVALAQQDYFHRPSPFAGKSLLTLALFDEVRSELKCSPDVAAREDALLFRLQKDLDEAIGNAKGNYATVRESIDNLNNQYDEDCLKILSTEQASRLKQLFLQYNGSNVLTHPIIAKEVGISKEQLAKLKAIQADIARAIQDTYTKPLTPADIQKAIRQLREDLKQKLPTVLDAGQRLKFQAMQGVKFEFKKP